MENTVTSKNIIKRISDAVVKMPRFSPVWFTISFILLLYIRNLGQEWYQIFIPAILVYGIGASLIGTLHRLIALSYQKPNTINNEMTIPWLIKFLLYFLHSAWFGLFVLYLIHRKIIWI